MNYSKPTEIIFICLLALSCSDRRVHVDHDQLQTGKLLEYNKNRFRESSVDMYELAALKDQILGLKQRSVATENPGALIEAFAWIKTGRNGERYQTGYLVREFEKAKLRNADRRLLQDPLPWVERGPGNVSGRARAIVVDPADETGNTWWVATIGGGVWKTPDAGTTWENKTADLSTLTTTTLVIAPSNPDVMYVGTGMGYGRIVDLAGSGIWKSVDHGETWSQLENTANGELLDAVNRIVVDPANENVLLACSNGFTSHFGPKSLVNGAFGADRKSGIFRSIDGGASWTQVFDPDEAIGTDTDNRVQQIIADPTDFNTLYASVNEVGVIKSTDGGLTWVVKSDFTVPGTVGVAQGGGFGLSGISMRSELAIAPTEPTRIYAAVERPKEMKPDLYMSTDSGETWTIIEDSGNDPSWFATSGGNDRNSGWFNNTITVHPFNKNIVYVGGVNIYQITIDDVNNTRTTVPIAWWITNNQGLPQVHADHHFSVTIVDDEASGSFRLLIANDGGLGISPDGGVSWQQITGMETTQFYGVDKKPGENIYLGGTQDNGSWMSGGDPDGNSNWNFVIGGDGFESLFNANNGNLVMGTSQGGNVSRSIDGGQTWSPVTGAKSGAAPFISKLATNKSDPELVFAVSQNGIARTDDFGATWSITPVQGNWLGFRPFDNAEVSLASPQVIWISSRLDVDPAAGIPGGIHISTDAGLSFSEISANFPEEVSEASGIATHPTDRNTAYFLFSVPGTSKILKTTDLGQTFTDISGFPGPSTRTNDIGFPDVGVFDLLVMPFNDNIMWAGTEIGIVSTEDAGGSWALMEDFPNVAVFQINLVDGQIVVATQGRGIWTVDLPELADYALPVLETLSPRLLDAALSPRNEFNMTLDLRSAYDSTHLLVDGNVMIDLEANAEPSDQVLTLTPDSEQTVSIQVISYKDGEAFKSSVKQLFIYPVETIDKFSTNFNNPSISSEFVGNGFSVTNMGGFSSGALHSTHPYPAATDLIFQLKKSMVVSSDNPRISYRDVVLVETGLASTYTDPNFFDFVIVEGSSDGFNWKALIPGYDSSLNSIWADALSNNPNASGNEQLFVDHEIDLTTVFNPGDTVFIRFRLFSDAGVVHWGWAVDDLFIQDEMVLGFEEDLENRRLSIQLIPNPLTGIRAKINYHLTVPGEVRIDMITIYGQKVWQTSPGFKKAGSYQMDFNPEGLASGVYILRIECNERINQFRVVKQ